MIHVFTANVHYKECQIQPTTSQGCCQTFKDYLVFYQTSLVQLAYEGTGVTLNSAFSQIRLACVSLLPVLRGELFGNWNPEIFLQCDMILLSWSTGLWDIQHLENRLLCFSIKVHEDNRLVSLLREAPLEVMREGYLPNYGYYYTGAYTTLLFVKKKKKFRWPVLYSYLLRFAKQMWHEGHGLCVPLFPTCWLNEHWYHIVWLCAILSEFWPLLIQHMKLRQ